MKRLISGIMCAAFALTCFNSAQITAFASYADARNQIVSELESFDNAELFNFVDTVKDIPDNATIVDQQYRQNARKRYSVDYDSVTLDITEYENNSITIELTTLKPYDTVNLPNIVVDENEFTFGIQQTNFGKDYTYKDFHGSSVTDVPLHNESIVTHRVQVKTTNTRGEKFATITISRNMKTATKSVEIRGFAKIVVVQESPYKLTDGMNCDLIEFQRWLDSYEAEVGSFNSVAIYDDCDFGPDGILADSQESYDVIDKLITDTYGDAENSYGAVYWVAQKPRLSAEDSAKLAEFFGNGFDYSKCRIDYLSDVSSTQIMLPIRSAMFNNVMFNKDLIARPEYDLGMTIHYYDKNGLAPEIMFNEEYNGKINKLTDEQTYIKTLEGSLNEKSEEISRLESEISKLKAQKSVTSNLGDVNNDNTIDAADAQLILNYYVYTLANSDAEPLEDWISKIVTN